MGTLIEITIVESDKNLANKAINKSFSEISRLENIMSSYNPSSELSNLNATAGKNNKVPISPDLLKVIRRGIHWGKLSSGAFDISVGPITKLWNFNAESPTPPEPINIKNATSLINFRDIFVEGNSISYKKNGMLINLGAIGKGYAVDRAVETLKNSGIKSGIINAGGDLMVFGFKEKTNYWRIGLQHPRKPEKILAKLALKDKAIATSGDYQRYFFYNGKRYHHILNPENGWPSDKVISATIIANTVEDADALSTALFVLGAKKGLDLINSLEDAEGMIISNLESVGFSNGFENLSGVSLQSIKDNLS